MPAGPTLSWEILAAGFGHAILFGVLALSSLLPSCSHEPLFKPENTIQVALAGPPKNVTRMPQKAERAPDVPKAASPEAPTPPPPPNSSDMAFKTPDAPKTKGDPNADARQRAIDDLRRQQALRDLSAPIGKEDRLASNPDGSEDGSSQASEGLVDPELAKWVVKARAAIAPNWHPLPTLCKPGIEVTIRVQLDASGKQVESPEIAKKSGSVSFDEAARRAAEMTTQLPPLPAKYAGSPVTVRFNGKECQ